jgi:hypothetical protein
MDGFININDNDFDYKKKIKWIGDLMMIEKV